MLTTGGGGGAAWSDKDSPIPVTSDDPVWGNRNAPVTITLVDRRNHHVFQPLLYQVATAALSPADISAPIRSVLRRQRNAEVLMAEVTEIDREGRRIGLAHRRLVQVDCPVQRRPQHVVTAPHRAPHPDPHPDGADE